MEPKEALLIINPIAGTRSKGGLAKEAADFLRPKGIKVVARYTAGAGDAAAFAREAAERGVAMVISAGGDGTVNEIANSLAHTGIPLGIIPMGSGNGLARSLGISQEIPLALEIIAKGHTILADRGIVNGHPFYCTFGMGLDAAVSEKFSQMKRRGRATYIRSFIKEFITYNAKPYAIEINGKVITRTALLIAVCNASQYGNNVFIAPKAKLTDGLLDITMVHSDTPLATVFMGVELISGFIDRNTKIETFQVREAKITRLEGGPVHIDGEPRTMGKKMTITCDKGALKLFAPEKEPEFKPIVSPLRALFNDMRYEVMSRIKP